MVGKRQSKADLAAPSPVVSVMPADAALGPAVERTDPANADAGASGSAGNGKQRLADHKGKLAVGVAAMLGAAIFYKWRETRLSKEDPEEYARLQRLKESIRHREMELERQAEQVAQSTQSQPARSTTQGTHATVQKKPHGRTR